MGCGCGNFFSPSQPEQNNLDNPISCSNVVIDAYTPTCYSPVGGNNLCNHLAGINNAICALQSETFDCSDITVTTGPFSCIVGTTSSMSLCTLISDINTTFCGIFASLPQGTGSVGVVDGNGGTFSGVSGITGITSSGNVTLALDNTITHGASIDSMKATSTSTADGSISTSSPLSVKGGQTYEIRTFVFAGATSPTGSVVSLSVSGSGVQIPITTYTVGTGNWKEVVTLYTPDMNQTVLISINVSSFTNAKYLNFADLVCEVKTAQEIAGPNYDFQLPQFVDLAAVYNSFAVPFVNSGCTLTTSGSSYAVTVAQTQITKDGKSFNIPSSSVTVNATKDNYLYYDTWTNSYAIKAVTVSATAPTTDDTQIVLWKITTNGSGVTGTTDLRVLTPLTGPSIAPASITGTQIAANTVASANMTLTGVSAGTYIGSLTVDTSGRVTAATNLFSFTTPLNNANIYYDSGTSLWKNRQGLYADASTSSLSPGAYSSSPALTMTGYYNPSVLTAYSATITHILTGATPASKLQLAIGGSNLWSLNNSGNVFMPNTSGAPGAPVSGGFYQYSHNITNGSTYAAPTFMDAAGNIMQLTKISSWVDNSGGTPGVTLNSYTPNSQSSAYTGIASGVGGSPYAQLTDLNALRVAYQNLQASYDNLLGIVEQMMANMNALGIL
ncbi:MAG: hypothetical protein ACHP6H_01300 [Legionellales bacterium]